MTGMFSSFKAYGSALILFLISAVPAVAQDLLHTLDTGGHPVGFSVEWVEDASRPPISPGTRGRTVQVVTWYPTTPVETPAMTVGDYAVALGAEGPVGWPDAVAQMSVSMEPGLPPGGLEAIQALQLRGHRDAVAALDNAPTIILAPGLYFESPLHLATLGEYLASHGYRVISVPLIGHQTTLATLSPEDLDSFVDDLLFARGRLAQTQPNSAVYAVVGFDLGGVAALQLATLDARVKAIVSLDSGIAFPDLMHRLAAGRIARSDASLLHITRPLAELQQRGVAEDLTLTEAALGERTILRLPGLRHADFTLIGVTETVRPGLWGQASADQAASLPVVYASVRRFLDERLLGGAAEPVVLAANIEVEHLPAGPGSFDRFVNELLSGAPLSPVRSPTPEQVDRLGQELIYRRSRADLALIAANALEHVHGSGAVEEMRGDARRALNQPDLALQSYRAAEARRPSQGLATKIASLAPANVGARQ